ncbi:MAG: hypothetical protein JO105_02145 [Hyphomicrobiales bacterium]|nr:hypothetical protein [Hyphomicrobiales bacterium]
MWDGRSRRKAARARGSGEEPFRPFPQARPLGAIKPRDAARVARLESLRTRRSSASASLVLFGVALLATCAGVLFLLPARGGATMPEEPKIAARDLASVTSEPPQWTSLAHPAPLFTLVVPELQKTEKIYQAMRSTFGEGREDRLVFGEAAREEAPFAEIAIYRTGSEAGEPVPFFVDLSRHAASAGVSVAKATPGASIRSKFGEMESAEARLVASSVERSCLAFRHAIAGESLRLLGWYCAPAGSASGTMDLACLVERLELSGVTDDKVLREAFAAVQTRRIGCAKPATVVATNSALSLKPLLETKQVVHRGTKARHRRIP